MRNLVLIHRSSAIPLPPIEGDESWVVWQTCVRQVAFGLSEFTLPLELSDADQVFEGEAAYQMTVELICGLHSPLVGETEVLGQFKKFVEENLDAQPELRTIWEQVQVDAKQIRTLHLSELGSQSYGSLARRLLRGSSEIHILGAGLLAKETLPWLCDLSVPVTVHSRDIERARSNLQSVCKNRALEYRNLARSPLSGAVIIAAPMTAADLNPWINSQKNSISMILDFRGNSTVDPLDGQAMTLEQFFAELETHRQVVEEKVTLAKAMISQLMGERNLSQKVRPYGWDDICA